MLECKTISIAIERHWQEVYETIWRPEFFPTWASGLSQSGLQREGQAWVAQGPQGRVKIRFTEHNAFGIMDHHVVPARGPEVYIPLRVIQNGDGAVVMLTLFRQPGMSDEKYAEDEAWVERDLAKLRTHCLV